MLGLARLIKAMISRGSELGIWWTWAFGELGHLVSELGLGRELKRELSLMLSFIFCIWIPNKLL